MAESEDVAPYVVDRLRAVCLALPGVHEERAWVGLRWRIRGRTFAHVLVVQDGRPASYARAAAADTPVTVLTFHATGPDLLALTHAGPPFHKPPWSPTVVGMVLGPDTDWDEVTELLVDSYCVMAPKKLARSVGDEFAARRTS